MTLQAVSFTIAGRPVGVEGWQFNDSEAGYDQCSGVISETEYRGIDSPSQGAEVAAWGEDGAPCWAGRFAAPPQILDSKAHFNAVGYKEEAAKKVNRLFIQSYDMSQWVPADSDPHLSASDVPVYDHIRKVHLEANPGSLRFSLPANQGMATNEAAAYVFYAEGVELRQVKYRMTYATQDEFAKLQIQVQRAIGPTGTETSVATHATTTANNGTLQTDSWATAGMEIITLGLQCNDGTFTPNANRMRWMLTKVRVNSDITSADFYYAYNLMLYIGGQLGWDTSGVDIVALLDILPFDWTSGSWLEAALYVAELEDRFLRVGAPTDTGPFLEYNDWGTRNWTVYTSAGADPDLKPLELFNEAWVWYETAAGVRRKKSRTAVAAGITDPLADAGITNIYEFEMEDRQKDSVLAQNIADKLVRRFAAQRYAGSVDVVSAVDTAGRDDPRGIRYGDTITIADWGPGEAQTLRVMEVAQSPTGVQVGVEQPVNLAALVAHTTGRKHRNRKRRRGQRG